MINSKHFEGRLSDESIYTRPEKPLPTKPSFRKNEAAEFRSFNSNMLPTLQTSLTKENASSDIKIVEKPSSGPPPSSALEQGLFIPTLSLFGILWSTLDNWCTNETKLFLLTGEMPHQEAFSRSEELEDRRCIVSINLARQYVSICLVHWLISSKNTPP